MSRGFPPLSRRAFLRSAASLAAAGLLAPALPLPLSAKPKFRASPFTLGVASGDPWAGGAVLWTRLALDLFDTERWGLSEESYEVGWSVHDAENAGREVKSGIAFAGRHKGYAVHVEVDGLQPGRRYKYRFRCGGEESIEGFTKTAPRLQDTPQKLRFGFCSCAEYENGRFAAYRAMAGADLDFAVHLGDYIYEQSYEHFRSRGQAPTIRRLIYDRFGQNDEPIKIKTLAQYRRRYAEYKSDPDLQEAHRMTPWIVTWDDHEVDNDYAADKPENSQEPGFAQRVMAAYRAYFENMPLRLSQLAAAGQLSQLYRRLDFGQLLRLHMLDERQYRQPQPCRTKDKGGRLVDMKGCAELREPRHMLGEEQLGWLAKGLDQSPALWNVLAQGVVFAQLDSREKDEDPPQVWSDGWSGYPWERDLIIELMQRNRAKNPVVISGDIHSHWVNRIRKTEEGKLGAVVAPEFVAASIASFPRNRPEIERRNKDTVLFHDGNYHGYVLVDLTPKVLEAAMVRMIKGEGQTEPAADHTARFRVEAGNPEPRRI